ncbi:MAG: hypothetical protein DRN14_02590 [Thermoplasmata archaeon]|nr:MAG: hypothetical protein DRN14_02590 [Thermoplasmata archaeon]
MKLNKELEEELIYSIGLLFLLGIILGSFFSMASVFTLLNVFSFKLNIVVITFIGIVGYGIVISYYYAHLEPLITKLSGKNKKATSNFYESLKESILFFTPLLNFIIAGICVSFDLVKYYDLDSFIVAFGWAIFNILYLIIKRRR